MAKEKPKAEDILRDMFIAQLGLAGIPQGQIRRIVGVDMWRVSRIVRLLKKAKGER